MNRIKLLSITLIVAVAFWGCNEILEDVSPATSLPGDLVVNDADGVEALRASMYSHMRASFGYTTQHFVAPSAFTDETRNRPGSTRFQAYTQATGTDGGRTHPGTTWSATYDIIQDANIIIGAIGEGVLPAETLNRYRGEALALRAFAMHNLVRGFGYEPGQEVGGWDRGVIIRTEPTLDVADADFRARSTVAQVYDQIFADLNEAKSLLAGHNSDTSYITEAFVDGMMARAHLYAGNWTQAAQAAEAAMANFPAGLQNTPDGVAGMFDENAGNHPEALFVIRVNPVTEAIAGSNANNGLASYTSNGFAAQQPTQFVIDQYEDGDYRLGWYGDCIENQTNAGLNVATGCENVNDNAWSLLKFNGNKGTTGSLVDDIPYMRLAEVYLIHAEASARAANSPAAGVTSLNDLRSARGVGPVPATALANMTAFEDFILAERVRELAMEGHRFWDLKRMGRDIRNPDGSSKIRYDSYRILAPVPTGELGVNELLEDNPGYS